MEDKERCTLGIIGAGNILDSHLRALEQLPRIDVTAVCDTHVERRKQIAAQLNIRSYADYRDLLAEPPDAVLVALPHGLHCAVTVDALRAGCHVLVEKPMAVDVEECRQMLSAAEMCGRQLLVAESASSLPGPVRTGEKFARGDLGEFFTGGIVNERFYLVSGPGYERRRHVRQRRPAPPGGNARLSAESDADFGERFRIPPAGVAGGGLHHRACPLCRRRIRVLRGGGIFPQAGVAECGHSLHLRRRDRHLGRPTLAHDEPQRGGI